MSDHISYDRRSFMSYFASIGLGSTLLPGILWAKISSGEDITAVTMRDPDANAIDGLKDHYAIPASTPVPEPETLVTLLFGLAALMACTGRRQMSVHLVTA